MKSIQEEIPAYISVDVETAGPTPGEFALLSIGACTVQEPRKTFYIELRPDKDRFDPQAMSIHQLDPAILARDASPPRDALLAFEQWLVETVPAPLKPIFVAFNAPFDWMFVADYFQRYLGRNPFGHSALDIKALYMGVSGSSWAGTSGEVLHALYLDNQSLSHNALQDAIDQAVIFMRILENLIQSNQDQHAQTKEIIDEQ